MGRTPRIPPELRLRPFSLDEARAAGITLSALRGKSWRRLGSKMYCWAGRHDDRWGLIHAYRRALPPSAVFAGRTAAWMHGLDVDPAKPAVEVDLPADLHLRPRAGLHVRHCQVTDEIVKIEGIRATTLERTLLDIATRRPKLETLILVDMAIARRLTTSDDLCRYAESAAGRPGSARLCAVSYLGEPAESPMETRLRWLLLNNGLPRPQVQTKLYDRDGEFVGRADLYYPLHSVIIEFDGGNHRERLISDDRRQNRLLGAGYRMLRFTSADVLGRPATVVAEVRAALHEPHVMAETRGILSSVSRGMAETRGMKGSGPDVSWW